MRGPNQPWNNFVDQSFVDSNWNREQRLERGVVEVFGNGNVAPDARLRKIEDDFLKKAKEIERDLHARKGDGLTPLPLRPGYNTLGQETVVYANYFPIRVSAKGKMLHKYNIAMEGATISQAKKGRLIQLLLQEMKLNVPYRTNFRDIICTPQKLPGYDTKKVFEIAFYGEDEDGPPEKSKKFKLNVTYDKAYDVEEVVRALNLNNKVPLPNDMEAVVQVLNAVFNHGPSQRHNTAMVSAKSGINKYFDQARARDNQGTFKSLGFGVEAKQGFIKSVRLGTDQLLLNINVTCAVFAQPVPLKTYFGRMSNLRGSTRDWESGLKLLRVDRKHIKRINKKTNKKIPVPASIWGLAKRGDGKGTPKPPQFTMPKDKDWANVKEVSFWLEDEKKTNGKYITVYDFFMKNYPDFFKNNPMETSYPVVNVGGSGRPVYLPMEVAHVLEGNQIKAKLNGDQTAEMVNFACRRPMRNANAIMNQGRKILCLDDAADAKQMADFGLEVGKDMLVVNSRLLPAPGLQYGGPRATNVMNGGWNLANQKFQTPSNIRNWTWMTFKNQNLDQIQRTVQAFVQEVRNYGVNFQNEVNLGGKPHDVEIGNLERLFAGLASMRVEYLLLVLPAKDTQLYNRVKTLGDVQHGIHTVCCVASKFCKPDNRTGGPDLQYFANIAMKFNLKAGGVNHLLKANELAPIISGGKTMLIGIDVTHPAPGSTKKALSVASMVASTNKTLASFPGVISVQRPSPSSNDGAAREMVDELTSMLTSRLVLWKKHNQGQLPENIILYRDGVSEGQLDQVLTKELPLLRKACDSMYAKGKTPRFTIIVCSKRHHTRFYPAKSQDASSTSNCKAGTCVDRTITRPDYWEFFLQSQHCIQGTARPCRYIVIHDEIFRDPKISAGNPANTIFQLTYNLCHLWQRATKSVGLCPPAYYADVLCERARAYLGSVFDAVQGPEEPKMLPPDQGGRRRTYKYVNELREDEFEGLEEGMRNLLLGEGEENRRAQQSLVDVHARLRDSMFFI